MPFARRAPMRMTREQAYVELAADGWEASPTRASWTKAGRRLHLLRGNVRMSAAMVTGPGRMIWWPNTDAGRFAAVRYAQQLAAIIS